jgi:hypothetical protein
MRFEVVEMEEELRELLQRKANSLPPHRTVPVRMLGRAKKRMALTISGGLVTLIVVAVGAYSGARALTTTTSRTPGGHRPSGVATETAPGVVIYADDTASPPASPVPACSSSELQGTISLEGAAGSAVGSIFITNSSTSTCMLQGRPTVQILDANDEALDVGQVPTHTWWQVEGTGRPAGWPIVTLDPGGSARIRVSWSNYCGDQQPATWQVAFGARETLTLPDPGFTPMCGGPELDSLIQVGPVEPQT